MQAFGSFGGPGRQPGKPHRKAYVYAPSLRCRPDAPLTERLGILRELRAQFALDGGRVEQLTECKLDGRFRPANVRRRYVTADLNRPVVVHLRAA